MTDINPAHDAARQDLTDAMRDVLFAVAQYNVFVEAHAEEYRELVGRITEASAI